MYDGFGNRTETTTFTEAASQGERTTVMRYDAAGAALTGLRDAAGHWTQAENDALGRPKRVETTRTVAGQTQPEAIVTTMTYDALGRVVASVAPGGAVTEMDYDASGNATEMRAIAPAPGESPAAACAAPDSPRCVRERIVYDAGERAIAMTDPLGNETRAEYDTRGRLTRTVSPLGAETRREYDLGGNLVRTIDPVGAETRFVYDGEDRLACTTNALGQVTRLVRDAEGRVIERWFPLSQCDFASAPAGRRVEKIEYDAEGMPLRMGDAEDREVALGVDELGRVRSVTALPGTPDAATTAFAYDLAGRPLARTDALGHAWRFRYRLGVRRAKAPIHSG